VAVPAGTHCRRRMTSLAAPQPHQRPAPGTAASPTHSKPPLSRPHLRLHPSRDPDARFMPRGARRGPGHCSGTHYGAHTAKAGAPVTTSAPVDRGSASTTASRKAAPAASGVGSVHGSASPPTGRRAHTAVSPRRDHPDARCRGRGPPEGGSRTGAPSRPRASDHGHRLRNRQGRGRDLAQGHPPSPSGGTTEGDVPGGHYSNLTTATGAESTGRLTHLEPAGRNRRSMEYTDAAYAAEGA